MSRTVFVVVAASLVISGCAGRTGAPVATSNPLDSQLSCAQMAAEINNNHGKVGSLQAQEKSASNANIAIGVVGALLFWPALFALDTGDAEKVEIQGYNSRKAHLTGLMMTKNCSADAQAKTPTAREITSTTVSTNESPK